MRDFVRDIRLTLEKGLLIVSSPNRFFLSATAGIVFSLLSSLCVAQETNALSLRTNIMVNDHRAFTIIPGDLDPDEPIPWVWYAPTLGKGLPGQHEIWMFNRLYANGIAIAGIDVGESYGSPKGVAIYQALYDKLTRENRFSRKPVLLGRSRGGLMLYSWAVCNPSSIGAIAGIYPVCNLISYPGLERAAPAFHMSAEELRTNLGKLNPVEMLAPLAAAKIPIFHLQGDNDKVVPLGPNSKLLADRINTMGGNAQIRVIKGQGHNLWNGWFTNEELIRFIMKFAKPSSD